MTNPSEKFEYVYPKKAKLRSYSPAVRGHSGQIRKAAELLLGAKRPIIYAGGGVILGKASAQLTELAKMLNLPVTNTLMGLGCYPGGDRQRSEEHTSELQSLMRISYAVFCLKKKKKLTE